jgi:hypothetical protein
LGLKSSRKIHRIKQRYKLNHKDQVKAAGIKYRQRTRKIRNERKKLWRHKNPDKVKNEKLKRNHGITLIDFKKMLLDQNNKCKICDHLFTGKEPYIPCVDHDHNSLKVRGLLCRNCNSGIGGFNDDQEFLTRALNWVE